MREFLVAGIFSAVVMLFFGIFAAAGWPGDPDKCIHQKPSNGRGWHTCYCEDFNPREVEKHKPGVRQVENTWLNLYALGTGGLVAGFMFAQRKYREKNPGTFASDENRMWTTDWAPLLYLPALIFLGLGSMWFHASLVSWGGFFDQASMFLFAGYLWFYTLTRAINKNWPMYTLYPASVVVMIVFGILGIKSFVIIFAVVCGGYFAAEIVIWASIPAARPTLLAILAFWVPAFISFALAFVFWILSDSGKPLCYPDGFQFHSLWHILAGAMAVLLYFYWRKVYR